MKDNDVIKGTIVNEHESEVSRDLTRNSFSSPLFHQLPLSPSLPPTLLSSSFLYSSSSLSLTFVILDSLPLFTSVYSSYKGLNPHLSHFLICIRNLPFSFGLFVQDLLLKGFLQSFASLTKFYASFI